MKYFGLSLHDTRAMPIKSFWKLNQMIDRVRAEEILDWLPALGAGMSDKNGIKQIIDQLRERVGEPMVVEQMEATKSDIALAKRIFG